MATGPLDGVRVLELTQIIAEPLGCVLLADMGADVIKVEPLEGEPWRMQSQFMPHESKPYQALNRGKKSLSLDLQSREGRRSLQARSLHAAYNVAEGMVRARYRNGLFAQALVEPGEVVEYTIDLAHTSNRFAKGHRIRLDVASSNFSNIDRNMNTGNPFGVDAEGQVARQTLFHDASHPSHLELHVTKSA